VRRRGDLLVEERSCEGILLVVGLDVLHWVSGWWGLLCFSSSSTWVDSHAGVYVLTLIEASVIVTMGGLDK
jgi:hypothetical protein